jgi:hypothetical protein
MQTRAVKKKGMNEYKDRIFSCQTAQYYHCIATDDASHSAVLSPVIKIFSIECCKLHTKMLKHKTQGSTLSEAFTFSY